MAYTPYDQIRYNQVRQKSSHNSYQREEGLYDQFLYWRLRSMEVDIHNGKTGRQALTGNWYVYHTDIVDSGTTVDKLSNVMTVLQGLQRTVPDHEVATIVIDLKDDFNSTHTVEDLDNMILSSLGADRVFTPGDLINLSPGSTTLQSAVAGGWPLLEDLRGKFIFILTGGGASSSSDKLNVYVDNGATANQRAAFIAPEISSASDITRKSYVVFFNLEMSQASSLGPTVFSSGFVSRVFTANSQEDWTKAVNGKIHLIATDKVNSIVDPWARTDNAKGWPFQGIEISISPDLTEPGTVYGVQCKSDDLRGDEDSFFFYYTDAGSADRTYVTFISSPGSHVEDWAKGSLMARESLDADSAYLAVVRPAKEPLRIQYRESSGDDTEAVEVQITPPDTIDDEDLGYVKLQISNGGRQVQGWGSVDGVNWTSIGSYTFPSPMRYQGYGTSSHNDGKLVKFLFFPSPSGPVPFTQTASIGDDVSSGQAFSGIYPP
jgi:hypothetical protein